MSLVFISVHYTNENMSTKKSIYSAKTDFLSW